MGDDLLAETTQRRVVPGDGVFDLPSFAETIRSTGFDGVVGLELLSAAHRELAVEDVARDLLAAVDWILEREGRTEPGRAQGAAR